MSLPLLSITIPTYNRSGYLRDALQSIFIQVKDHPSLNEQIEVVIADNASTDNTEEVAREFEKKFSHFVYIKNKTNGGFDRNVDIVVRGAHGVYVWYLGDDDVIVNGALEHMLDVMTEDTYSVISVTDRPLKTRPYSSTGVTTYSKENHISGLSPDECYIQGHLPSALSMLAFKRDEWLSVADFENHTPGWFYFETILRMAIKKDSAVLHIAKPMIETGQDMRWADGGAGLKIFIDCNRFLHKMIAWGYAPSKIEAELRSNAMRFPYVLLQSKVRGLPFTPHNWSLVRDFTENTPFTIKLISRFIYWLPNQVVHTARCLKKKLT